MSEKKAFENNEVLLWGRKQAKPELIEKYGIGNKNPKSKAKIVKDGDKVVKTVKKVVSKKRVFDENEKYTIDDLEFLNKEYDRIEEEASNLTDFDKMDELVEVQDKIYNLIEKLKKEQYEDEEKQYDKPEVDEDDNVKEIKKLNEELAKLTDKYIQSKGDVKIRDKMEAIEEKINKLSKQKKPAKKVGKSVDISKSVNAEPEIHDYEIIEKIIKMVGKGFKKGSPEALAHAEKMRQALANKKQPKVLEPVIKKETKARVQKGSEEAKALGKKLADAKKAKLEAKKKDEEELKRIEKVRNPTKPKGRPWYYIGDIPRGYREATETEAIEKGKVSEYGKYEVDETKYNLWNNYEILLDENKTFKEVEWTLNGLKKRILKSLQEIEILKSKLDNDKYKDKSNEFKTKLTFEKELRRHLQAGWNWYYKIYCEMKGIQYERKSFELPKQEEIKTTTESKIIHKVKEPEKIIDPRTGKEAKMSKYTGNESESEDEKPEGDIDVDLIFKNGENEEISLSTKYFTEDYKLISKYVPKLIKKNIILHKKYYTTKDYNKYFYSIPMKGGKLEYGDLAGLLEASYNNETEKVGQFNKDKDLSTKTSKVFINPETGQTVVAHRGTKEASDWLNNAVYALGNKRAYKLTPRYKEARRVQKRAYRKYGRDNITTIGHSQGGLQAEMLGKRGNETITLNKATRPFGNKSAKNQYDISSSRDLVSSLNPFQSIKNKGKSKVIKAQSYNPLTEHAIDILNREQGYIGK